MNIDDLKTSLTDTDCTDKTKECILMAYQNGQTDSALKLIKKDRCRLMEDMHRCGRKIDLLDTLIRTAEEKMKETDPLFIGR